MAERCELCGDDWHAEADTEGWKGICCPGAHASQEQRDEFIQKLGPAYLEHLLAEAEEYANAIGERKRRWYERERTEVTHGELQTDLDTRVEDAKDAQPWLRVGPSTPDEVIAAQLKADELSRGFEVDPPHLAVPMRPTVHDHAPGDPLVELTPEQKRQEYDAMMFVKDDDA